MITRSDAMFTRLSSSTSKSALCCSSGSKSSLMAAASSSYPARLSPFLGMNQIEKLVTYIFVKIVMFILL